MREIKEAFGFGNAICANGAMHYDLMNERVIEEWLIPLDLQFEFVKTNAGRSTTYLLCN
jgi:hypothetical protein